MLDTFSTNRVKLAARKPKVIDNLEQREYMHQQILQTVGKKNHLT